MNSLNDPGKPSLLKSIFPLLLTLVLLTVSLQVTSVPVQASSHSSLRINGASHPSKLPVGATFRVKGTVTSNYRITRVSVSILNSKKKVICKHVVYPYTYYYNLAALDNYILFNIAKTGKNYYRIHVTDEKKSVTKKWSFKVTSGSSGGNHDDSGNSKNNFLGYAGYNGVNYQHQTGDSRRIAALNKARKMATIKWRCALTFPAWFNNEGYYSTVTATDGTVSTKFLKGKTYVGIPFSMVNHSYDNHDWERFVKNGYSYSQIAAPYYSYSNLTTAKGSDCSYFVYQCMRAAGADVSYQTTYMMYNQKYYRKISKSSLKPGDILLTYDHVRLYAGRVGSQYAVFEASGDGSKTRYKLFSKNQLNAYSAFRYKRW